MMDKTITIDIDRLRKDIKDDYLGAYFCGGFQGALMESFVIEKAAPEKLVEIAQKQGIELRSYQRCSVKNKNNKNL